MIPPFLLFGKSFNILFTASGVIGWSLNPFGFEFKVVVLEGTTFFRSLLIAESFSLIILLSVFAISLCDDCDSSICIVQYCDVL